MKFHSMIVDDFLDDYESIRAFADTAIFEDVVNPFDGLNYPGICKDAPFEPFLKAITAACGNVTVMHFALRLSLAGNHAPYEVHSDVFMGCTQTAIVYLNRPEHCDGGTALMVHRSGITHDVNDDWRADESNHEAWAIAGFCPMVTNRAFIFDSSLLHRSEPLGGFGSNATDGRLVAVIAFR